MNDDDNKIKNGHVPDIDTADLDIPNVASGVNDTQGDTDFEFIDSDEEGNVLPTKDVAKKLREEVKKLRTERDEYLVGWQRAKADYVNLQRDSLQKISNAKNIGKEDLLESLLPALDSFDMAISNKESWEKVDPNWRVGIEYIYNNITTALENSGITKIGNIGEAFDPNLHEGIETLPTDDESLDHTIAMVIQSGYRVGDRVIRPARVKVYQK
jgi:molecular chaperone GrpE